MSGNGLGNFQCWDVLLILTIEGQQTTVPAIKAGNGCLDISFLSPSLWERARYKLKYRLKRANKLRKKSNGGNNINVCLTKNIQNNLHIRLSCKSSCIY